MDHLRQLKAYRESPLPEMSKAVAMMAKDLVDKGGVTRFQFVDLLERCTNKGSDLESELLYLWKKYDDMWLVIE